MVKWKDPGEDGQSFGVEMSKSYSSFDASRGEFTSGTVICSYPTTRDPYEAKMVKCGQSSVPGWRRRIILWLEMLGLVKLWLFTTGIRIPEDVGRRG